jgi:hypothetical protein
MSEQIQQLIPIENPNPAELFVPGGIAKKLGWGMNNDHAANP